MTTTHEPPSIVEAQLALGQMHLDRGEHEQAIEHFRAAARSGEPVALNMLGRAYERGWGTVADAVSAAAYYDAAARQGDAWAMFNLADLYVRGAGVLRDEAAAYALYVEAARKGLGKSLNMLGLFHEEGRVVEKDCDAAMALFQAGADAGDCWAMFNAARLSLLAGAEGAAVRYFELSLSAGFHDYYRHLWQALQKAPQEQLRNIAERARCRMIDGASNR
ncbi:tetratricopeptide repeat protein [Rhizobium helianthi]|uniref:Tetratricopeptide repeat protein n=1 Tax=Rhizobium helianthi TaxID=1132695 RepID=A0ABW4M166_9HYPH